MIKSKMSQTDYYLFLL